MTVVIDIGCARHGNDYSIERLIEEFSPDVLYGFDPSEAIRESTDGLVGLATKTSVLLSQQAAWIYDGEIGFREDGINSWVTELKGAPQIKCFDLAEFILSLDDDDIVLKMDCEGSEYDLLRHLILKGVDEKIRLAWIEWHEPDRGRAKIEDEWAGEMVEWKW